MHSKARASPNYARLGFEKSPRLGAGVFAVDGHPVVIALRQAHDFAAPQVDGWE